MDFRELLKFEELEKNRFEIIRSLHFRQPAHIHYTNGFIISIAAHAGAYCSPNEITDIYKYTKLEIAFFHNQTESGFIDLKKHPDFEKFKYLDQFQEYYGEPVYGYVPIKLIQHLFEYVESIYERIIFTDKGVSPSV